MKEILERIASALEAHNEILKERDARHQEQEKEEKEVYARAREQYAATVAVAEATENLKAQVAETAEAHGIEPQVIHNTAQRFQETKGLARLVPFVGTSPELAELMYALSEGDTLDKLIETARTDPHAALHTIVDMEHAIAQARAASDTAALEKMLGGE